MEDEILKFGTGNAKLGKNTLTFALPAGHFCPFAKNCLSKANRVTGRIKDGKNTTYRCFGATIEGIYPNVRKKVWNNADLLRDAGLTNRHAMADLIIDSLEHYLTKKIKYVRIHETGGDFFNEFYLESWIYAIKEINKQFPDVTFYAYTKAYKLVYNSILPDIASITYSDGGINDHLISEYNLKTAEVVNYTNEANEKGLEIDIDDSLARDRNYKKSFALLIHGTQPKGSTAGKANYYNVKNKVKKLLINQKKELAMV